MKDFPYKLNLPKMEERIKALPLLKKINLMMSLHSMKDDGIIAVSDLVQLFAQQEIPDVVWYDKLARCSSESGIFLFSKTLSFYERCGKISITNKMRESVQFQLNKIYKLTNN